MSEEIDQIEKPAKPRRQPISVSRFILFLAAIVGGLLLVVNNSVTVDRLVIEIGSLDSAYTRIKFQNDSLQGELKKLSDAENITRIASQRLGLEYSSETLDQIQVDKSKLENAAAKDARDTAK